MYQDIKESCEWKSVEKISKGWSSDEKYRIETKNDSTLLLRISNIENYIEKEKEFDIISKFSTCNTPMSMPISFGKCNDGRNTYMLLSWVEGKDLEEILPTLSEEQQYLLGREAGGILKKFHSIRVEDTDMPKETKIPKKLLQLSKYEQSKVRIEGDEVAIDFVKQNISQIWKKQPVYLHGDFHPGNLIYINDEKIGTIDFNRWEIGDPYEEFYKLESFARELSVPYCIGQIDAYFNNDIPDEFWTTLAVYVAHSSLYSIKWAEKFGQQEIDGMVTRCRMALKDYDSFHRSIPIWYEDKYRNILKR
ncbi:MAG: phosphotransferase [Lachnospiraceae bacterium]